MKSLNYTYDAEIPLHALRSIGFATAAAILFAGIAVNAYPGGAKWLIPLLVFYPVISMLITRQQQERDWMLMVTALIDVLIIGFVISLVGFNLIPLVTLILMTSNNIIMSNGLKVWIYSVLAIISGMICAKALFDIEAHIETPLLVNKVCGTALFIYYTLLSYYTSHYQKALKIAQQELRQVHEERTAISKRLSKYLAPQVWGSVFANKKAIQLEPQRKRLTIFFSDIKNFTEITEEMQPEALTELLNGYLTEMSVIAQRYGGTIDKFIGDAILIFFGDPNTKGAKQDAIACVSMAIEMRKKMKSFRKTWRNKGVTRPMHIRMGIHSGYSTIGSFGAESRMDYTIIGKEVNLASRLESVAAQDQICISDGTYELVKETILCRNKGSITVKGFAKPVNVFEVADFRKDLGASHSYIEHEREGFSMYLDLTKIRSDPQGARRVLQVLSDSLQQLKSKISTK